MKSTLFFSTFIIVLAFCLKLWVVEGFTIPSPSMQPTLNIGDRIWIKKWPFFGVKKGEIVAFHSPLDENTNYVKRCMGLPHDSIALINGQYSLKTDNAKAFAIPQKGQKIHLTTDNFPFYQPLLQDYEKVQAGIIGNKMYINNALGDTYTFTQNYYFMLGDNQADSFDSRNWGLVPESHLIGTAFFIWKSK
jgi:signal peptidase I